MPELPIYRNKLYETPCLHKFTVNRKYDIAYEKGIKKKRLIFKDKERNI